MDNMRDNKNNSRQNKRTMEDGNPKVAFHCHPTGKKKLKVHHVKEGHEAGKILKERQTLLQIDLIYKLFYIYI